MMGKLIRINRFYHSDSEKLKKDEIIADSVKGQILMFTGIRYERRLDANDGDVNPSKKHKRG